MPLIDINLSRRKLLTYSALVPAFSSVISSEAAQGYVGFARQKNVTGGTGGTTVYIDNIEQLCQHLGGDDRKNIIVTKNITASGKQLVFLGSNKTLIGHNSNIILYNIYIYGNQSKGNVIFRNLNFIHSKAIRGNDDIQIRISSGSGYWLDNCKFPGHDWSTTDYGEDKLIYFGEKADFITISNCLFANHRYGCIFGYPEDGFKQFKGEPRITICNNLYSNVYTRAPGLFRYGTFEVYNNVIKGFHIAYTIDGMANVNSYNNRFYTNQKYFTLTSLLQGNIRHQDDYLNGYLINNT